MDVARELHPAAPHELTNQHNHLHSLDWFLAAGEVNQRPNYRERHVEPWQGEQQEPAAEGTGWLEGRFLIVSWVIFWFL